MIVSLKEFDILACDIQNAYLTVKFRELIWTVARPEFGSEQGSITFVKMELYGLKSSRAALIESWREYSMILGKLPLNQIQTYG